MLHRAKAKHAAPGRRPVPARLAGWRGRIAVLAALAAAALSLVPFSGSPASHRASAGAPPTCQGTAPLALPGTWTCSFDDEFDGTALDTTHWVVQQTANSGVTAGPDCYVNNPNNVSVSGGYLDLSVQPVAPFRCATPYGSFTASYTAGMVSTSGLFDQTYGAFEVNAKMPATNLPGLQETFWLYPQTLTYGPWPNSGEIDFAEFYSIVPWLDIPYIHYANQLLDLNKTSLACAVNTTTFNTYELYWAPGTLAVLYNGNLCLVDHPLSGAVPFNQPFFIALTQALGVIPNPVVPGLTPIPATTQVDWVRAWTPG